MRRKKAKTIQLEGSRHRVLDLARGRLALTGAVFIMAYLILALRVFDLSVFQYESEPVVLAPMAGNQVKEKTKTPRNPYGRADIVDRNGVLLASSLKMASLYADPSLIDDPEKLARELKQTIELPYTTEELRMWLSGDNRFIWLKRFLSPSEMSGVLQIGSPGLNFREEYRRVYPQGRLTSHILGYTDTDLKGLSGLEKGLESRLIAEEESLFLSLDIRVQNLLRSQIRMAVKKHHAKAGAGIVMKIKTGEVLGAVSYPDFDPHAPGNSPGSHLFNRFSLGVYELGSTFKIFSTAAYLDLPGSTMNDRFDVSRPMRKHGHAIRDFHGKETVLSLPEVFIYSSNIGAAQMGEAMGRIKMRKLFEDLYLTNRLRLDIPESGRPLIPYPWRPINTLTASYGHGIAVTPIQFTAAAASIVNQGEFVRPRFRLSDPDKAATWTSDNLKYSIISSQSSQIMRKLLRLVVTKGTGNLADVPGYQVGGKTGTAEKSAAGGYDRKKLIASFLGIFPMNDPEYAVFIMVDEPEGIPQTYGYATGGWVAAPAVGAVISGMGRLLGIPKKPYQDDGFLGSMKNMVRTNEEFENGVDLMPSQDTVPPHPLPAGTMKAIQEPKLVSY